MVRAQQPAELRGTVSDSTGASIEGAQIELQSEGGTRLATTNEAGQFTIENVTGGTLVARYPGFAPVTMNVNAEALRSGVQVRLAPASEVQRVIVTSEGDDRVPPVPVSVFAIPQEQIQVSGAATVDEVLRQTPGFSLFRRSGSLFANPTTQGASMRGIGASGASRTNVLLDGIPINDAFGRWVHWNAVPRVSIANVAVLNGGASDVYGGGALGGVVNLQSRPLIRTFGAMEISYGSLETPDLSFDGGVRLGKWGVLANGEVVRTHGYILVPASQRGAVDTPAGTADAAGTLQISRTLGEQGLIFARASSFGESRKNGTPLQINNTRLPSFAAGTDWTAGGIGVFSVRAYGSYQVYEQNSSSVAASRNAETLTNVQRGPSQDIGFAGQWQRTLGGRNSLTAGLEGVDAQGHSTDVTSSARTDAGGRQRTLGFFGQDALQITPAWVVTFGGRVDTWLNSRGYTHRTAIPNGAFTSTTFANRSQTAFNPRVSVLHTFRRNISASVTAYRAFRGPTLNELYRSFRVGNVVTNSNANLVAERLSGGEATVSTRQWNERLTVRGTFFWSEIADLVVNGLVSAVPAGCNISTQPGQPGACTTIIAQRQNIGNTRARGAELALQMRVRERMQIAATYVYTDSTSVSGTPPVRAQVPLVAKNEFTAQWSYTSPKWTTGAQARFLSDALDDTTFLPLDRAFTVDGEISHAILPHTHVFLAAQNLFNDRYVVARTPISSLGPPAMVRGGFRFDFGGQ
jgi:outer membrane receptor protein involved in Fe transport